MSKQFNDFQTALATVPQGTPANQATKDTLAALKVHSKAAGDAEYDTAVAELEAKVAA